MRSPTTLAACIGLGIATLVIATLVIATLVIATLVIATASASQAPAPASSEADRVDAADRQSVQDAVHGHYIEASFGLLTTLGVKTAAAIKDPDVFDQWAQVMSTMTGTGTFNPAKGSDFQVPAGQVADLRAADGVAAIPEIVRRARQTRIVVLDENHLEPRCRAFALEVARALRPLGYTVLAAEALKRGADDATVAAKMAQLSADGYVRQSSGYYLDDPVFSDFLRQSLGLGYRLVSYEFGGVFVSDSQRDRDEAGNLVRRALGRYPGAKILVYSGEHHAAKRPIASEGAKAAWMAQMLKEATGIDPLTIDQAGLTPIPMNRPGADLYDIAVQKAHDQPVVLMRRGEPLTVGLLAGSVDLQVVMPRSGSTDGRPSWLLAMGRKPSPIPASLLPTSGTHLIQAFVATEAEDAIPIDQVLVTAGQPAPALMLPLVAIRYAVQPVPLAGGLDKKPDSP